MAARGPRRLCSLNEGAQGMCRLGLSGSHFLVLDHFENQPPTAQFQDHRWRRKVRSSKFGQWRDWARWRAVLGVALDPMFA